MIHDQQNGGSTGEAQLDEAPFDATRTARLLRATDGSVRVSLVNVGTGKEFASIPVADQSREGMASVMKVMLSMRDRIAAMRGGDAAMPTTYASRRPIGWGNTPDGWTATDPGATFGGEFQYGTVTYPTALSIEDVARYELAPVWSRAEDAVRFALAHQKPGRTNVYMLSDEVKAALTVESPSRVAEIVARNLRRDMTHRIDVWGTIPADQLAIAIIAVAMAVT